MYSPLKTGSVLRLAICLFLILCFSCTRDKSAECFTESSIESYQNETTQRNGRILVQFVYNLMNYDNPAKLVFCYSEGKLTSDNCCKNENFVSGLCCVKTMKSSNQSIYESSLSEVIHHDGYAFIFDDTNQDPFGGIPAGYLDNLNSSNLNNYKRRIMIFRRGLDCESLKSKLEKTNTTTIDKLPPSVKFVVYSCFNRKDLNFAVYFRRSYDDYALLFKGTEEISMMLRDGSNFQTIVDLINSITSLEEPMNRRLLNKLKGYITGKTGFKTFFNSTHLCERSSFRNLTIHKERSAGEFRNIVYSRIDYNRYTILPAYFIAALAFVLRAYNIIRLWISHQVQSVTHQVVYSTITAFAILSQIGLFIFFFDSSKTINDVRANVDKSLAWIEVPLSYILITSSACQTIHSIMRDNKQCNWKRVIFIESFACLCGRIGLSPESRLTHFGLTTVNIIVVLAISIVFRGELTLHNIRSTLARIGQTFSHMARNNVSLEQCIDLISGVSIIYIDLKDSNSDVDLETRQSNILFKAVILIGTTLLLACSIFREHRVRGERGEDVGRSRSSGCGNANADVNVSANAVEIELGGTTTSAGLQASLLTEDEEPPAAQEQQGPSSQSTQC